MISSISGMPVSKKGSSNEFLPEPFSAPSYLCEGAVLFLLAFYDHRFDGSPDGSTDKFY